jgi:hypothetical protein
VQTSKRVVRRRPQHLKLYQHFGDKASNPTRINTNQRGMYKENHLFFASIVRRKATTLWIVGILMHALLWMDRPIYGFTLQETNLIQKAILFSKGGSWEIFIKST